MGASTTTRSRGKCSGKGLRDGLRRVKDVTVVCASGATCSTASASSVAAASSSLSCNSSWSSNRALRSEDLPYLSRRSLAISSFSSLIIASEQLTVARMHRDKDDTLGEDRYSNRSGHAPRNIFTLTSAARTLLKRISKSPTRAIEMVQDNRQKAVRFLADQEKCTFL